MTDRKATAETGLSEEDPQGDGTPSVVGGDDTFPLETDKTQPIHVSIALERLAGEDLVDGLDGDAGEGEAGAEADSLFDLGGDQVGLALLVGGAEEGWDDAGILLGVVLQPFDACHDCIAKTSADLEVMLIGHFSSP